MYIIWNSLDLTYSDECDAPCNIIAIENVRKSVAIFYRPQCDN